MKKKINIVLLCLLPMIISGCFSAKKLAKAEIYIPDRYIYADSAKLTDININWWEIFGDPTLNNLITTAIKNNKNLAAALSAVEESRLNMKNAISDMLPSVSIQATAGADYAHLTKTVQQYSLKPQLAWEIDIFGKLRKMSDAAKAEFLSTEYGYRYAILSLASEVASTYFTLVEYKNNLKISRKSYELRLQSSNMIDSMNYYGASSGLDLEQAKGLTASAAATVYQYERLVGQTENYLAILLGESPMRFENTATSPEDINIPKYIPVGLPSELLERRPDVMGAYYAMESKKSSVGAAMAARYPSIAITGDGGLISTAVRELFKGNPWGWSAAFQITEPLLSFGKNKRNVDISKEQYMQSMLDYEQSVITSLSEVETALITISTLRREIEYYEQQLESCVITQNMTNNLYKSGLTDYLQLLDAERTLFTTQIQYSSVLSQQLAAYIDLYKALGGGW